MFRIKLTDRYGAVDYIYRTAGGEVRRTSSGGMPLALGYGTGGIDETALRFRLEDAASPGKALAAVRAAMADHTAELFN